MSDSPEKHTPAAEHIAVEPELESAQPAGTEPAGQPEFKLEDQALKAMIEAIPFTIPGPSPVDRPQTFTARGRKVKRVATP